MIAMDCDVRNEKLTVCRLTDPHISQLHKTYASLERPAMLPEPVWVWVEVVKKSAGSLATGQLA